MPVVFEVVEECLDQRHVDLLEAQPLESDASVVATKPQQQRECVAVGPDGVGAQVALHGEVVCQEGRHVHGEIGRLHDGFLRGMTSANAWLTRSMTSGNSSAVRCR